MTSKLGASTFWFALAWVPAVIAMGWLDMIQPNEAVYQLVGGIGGYVLGYWRGVSAASV